MDLRQGMAGDAMKVLLDVNVLVDICGKSPDVAESFKAVDVMLVRGDEPAMLVCMAPTVAYVVKARGFASESAALVALDGLAQIAPMLDVIPSDRMRATELPMRDFEDALVAAAAERHGMDIIVTRNTKDFKDSPVRAMHPRDFAEQLCPPDYGYEEISDL